MTIESIIATYIEQEKIPGALTVISRRGKTILQDIQGYRDVKTQRPIQTDTLFRIYSMTKPVTAVAVMMLYEQGLLDLDDPIAHYLPVFSSMKVYTERGLVDAVAPITIRHLLTHSSGLSYSMMPDSPSIAELYRSAGINEIHARQLWDLETHINKLAELPLIAQPGTAYRYSESIGVCARLVEVLTGQGYRDFLIKRIFQPLAMVDTDYHVPPEKAHRLATLYERCPSGQGFEPTVSYGGDYTQIAVLEAGGAGLVSTAEDYLHFAQMLLNKGEYQGTRLLKSGSVQEIMSDQFSGNYPEKVPQVSKPLSLGIGFGFGGFVVVDPSVLSLPSSAGEYGWSGWASTFFWIDPEEEIIGMVLTQLIPKIEEDLGLGQAIRSEVYCG